MTPKKKKFKAYYNLYLKENQLLKQKWRLVYAYRLFPKEVRKQHLNYAFYFCLVLGLALAAKFDNWIAADNTIVLNYFANYLVVLILSFSFSSFLELIHDRDSKRTLFYSVKKVSKEQFFWAYFLIAFCNFLKWLGPLILAPLIIFANSANMELLLYLCFYNFLVFSGSYLLFFSLFALLVDKGKFLIVSSLINLYFLGLSVPYIIYLQSDPSDLWLKYFHYLSFQGWYLRLVHLKLQENINLFTNIFFYLSLSIQLALNIISSLLIKSAFKKKRNYY